MSLKKSQSFHVASSLKLDKDITDDNDELTTVVQNPLFKPRVMMVEMLLATDFELTSALCDVILLTEDGRTFAEAMIDFFQAHNKLDKLVEWSISKEINSTSSTSTLFRGACEATKLMPVLYSRLGSDYLKQLVGPLVKDITSSSQSFEIDPNKAEKGVDVKDNLKKLLSITNELLDHIYCSVDSCPSYLRYIFWYAKKEVTKKFPSASSIMVGVFFFLRFMIPAIVTPTQYGLLLEPPSPEAQRGLILISKLLQNLSNGIEFDSNHEDYMVDMNQFISEKMYGLQNFFNKLAEKCPNVELPSPSPESASIAVNTISSAIKDNKDKIINLLRPETKKIFFQFAEGIISESETLRNNTKKKLKFEKFQQKIDEEKFIRLEELLEEEIKQRKILEKNLQKLEESTEIEIRVLNQKDQLNEQRIQDLHNQVQSLIVMLSQSGIQNENLSVSDVKVNIKNKS